MSFKDKVGKASGSLSLRRAWIEIRSSNESIARPTGRSPYGERGLKSCAGQIRRLFCRVALLTESVD